ncbi:hypothetical protein EVAR_62281_1 [Eumeta japonica]|uniref:Uncharacterized protein n=1 Tax=Eumeta variegata TaxID=151549 RepID=A0A4C1YW77_EUMVA|nr:hypothetical protein EVAR_62281_1 [Eumeta japonica]
MSSDGRPSPTPPISDNTSRVAVKYVGRSPPGTPTDPIVITLSIAFLVNIYNFAASNTKGVASRRRRRAHTRGRALAWYPYARVRYGNHLLKVELATMSGAMRSFILLLTEIPVREADNALVTLLGSRVSIVGDYCIFLSNFKALLLIENVIKKIYSDD